MYDHMGFRMDWLSLRTKYMQLQKANMARLKRQLVVNTAPSAPHTEKMEIVPGVVLRISGEDLTKEKVKVSNRNVTSAAATLNVFTPIV